MKILTRYILRELLMWFVMALSAMTLIIVVFLVTNEAIRRGLPPAQVLSLIPYLLPQALSLAVPGTLLLATTSVYGRFAGWNEVIAIKSQGISPHKILEPMWAVAFLLSLVMVYVNDLAASWGREGMHRVVRDSIEPIALGILRTQRQHALGDLAIHVRAVEDGRLIQPMVLVKPGGGVPSGRIAAEEAWFETDPTDGKLKIVFRCGRADYNYDGRRVSALFDRHADDTFEVRDFLPELRPSTRPSDLALHVIPNEKIRQRTAIERIRASFAARAACQMLCGDFETLTGDEWKGSARILQANEERLCRLRTEPHRRWSAGFACLCFAWVGAPMAIRLRNRDMLTSFFLCFLPILLVYYPLLLLGLDGAKDGRLPEWSVWSGNLLMVAWGTYLLRRVIRY